jgi:hypothetical protein
MNLDDIAIIEGNIEADPRAYYEAIQRAINGGDAWKFQGSYGRTMMAAIEAGYCMLGRRACVDFYGSAIPSRSDVAPGSKGSRDYVVAQQSEDWAAQMEAVGTE